MKNKYLILNLCAVVTLFSSCSKDDKPTQNDEGSPSMVSKYIVTATPIASEGVADYILTADDLSKGKISTVGSGIEQDGTYRFYLTSNNRFFSLLYGQGNPGAVTTYELNSAGNLSKLSDFQSETVQAREVVGKDILMMKISRRLENPIVNWFRLDTDILQFVDEGEINTKELADKENGELAFFSWITQVGNKVYLPYFTIKATSDDLFGTEFPDEANIAVYSYPEMIYEKTITDHRTSFIGRYANNGLSVDEKGDAYAFSSAVAGKKNSQGVNQFTSTKPSAITRIKQGTSEFDDYYYDIEKASGGKYVTNHMYLGNGKFLVIVLNKSERETYYTSGKELAIVDVYAQSFVPVSGMPSYESINEITGRNNYLSEDGTTVYVGVNTKTGNYVYSIHVATAKATQGLEIEGGTITAISKLKVAK